MPKSLTSFKNQILTKRINLRYSNNNIFHLLKILKSISKLNNNKLKFSNQNLKYNNQKMIKYNLLNKMKLFKYKINKIKKKIIVLI